MTRKRDQADILVKRVREPAAATDGCRILIDRLWPRGMTKAAAQVSVWLKEIAPSTALRRAFHAGRLDWPAFVSRYRAELDGNDDAVRRLRGLVEQGRVTLLYDSRDPERNHARLLADYLSASS